LAARTSRAPAERLGDGLLHEQPAAGAAHLALVEEDAVDHALDRLVQRSIVEDDVCRLAAQLQGECLVTPGNGAADFLAYDR
jgi:hypothetical protein